MRVWGLVLVAACRYGFAPEPDGAGSVSGNTQLHASVSSTVAIAGADARVAFATADPGALYAVPPLPGDILLVLPDASGTAQLSVDAIDLLGRELTATVSVDIVANARAETTIAIGADLVSTCRDAVLDAGETDVDCGGPCPGCA